MLMDSLSWDSDLKMSKCGNFEKNVRISRRDM